MTILLIHPSALWDLWPHRLVSPITHSSVVSLFSLVSGINWTKTLCPHAVSSPLKEDNIKSKLQRFSFSQDESTKPCLVAGREGPTRWDERFLINYLSWYYVTLTLTIGQKQYTPQRKHCFYYIWLMREFKKVLSDSYYKSMFSTVSIIEASN